MSLPVVGCVSARYTAGRRGEMIGKLRAVLLLSLSLTFAVSFRLPTASLTPKLRPLPDRKLSTRFAFNPALLSPAFGVNSCLAVTGLALKQRALTSQGLAHAWALGVLLWSTLGGKGWLVCCSYLVFGSMVTKIKMKEKEALGIAEKRGGARGPENVWGSAASGAMCALGSVIFPKWGSLLRVGYVASLATKLSDTFASEVGKAYGQRTFLVTTLKPVPRGTEGAVSLEGTLAGVVGSLIMGGMGVGLGLLPLPALGYTAGAAFLANYVESLLGACLQNDKHPWATNEVINFINTAVGAGLAMGFARGFKVV